MISPLSRYLTLDTDLISTAIDGLLSPLPLQLVTSIVKKFLDSNTDLNVTLSMINITTDRLSNAIASDALFKQSMSLFLSVLEDTIIRGEHKAQIIALDSIGKLSRIHGKAELDLFESQVSSIIQSGVLHPNVDIESAAVRCLLSMLYLLL